MTSREAFEAAWRKEYPLHGKSVFMRSGLNPDVYAGTRVNDGWLMWQAAERSALERASDIAFDYVFTAMNAVEARKLKNAILEDAQSKDTEGA